MSSADQSTLPDRAAFDMQCPKQQLNVVELDEGTFGVTGCDKRATYVSACDGQPGHFGTTCKWVQN